MERGFESHPLRTFDEIERDKRRRELLERWHSDQLTYRESLELRDILAEDVERAEETKRTLIGLGLLGLFIYALSRKEEK